MSYYETRNPITTGTHSITADVLRRIAAVGLSTLSPATRLGMPKVSLEEVQPSLCILGS